MRLDLRLRGHLEARALHEHRRSRTGWTGTLLFQPGYQNDYPLGEDAWSTGFGDIRLGAKYNILDDYFRSDAVGLAVKGTVKLPTADEKKGLGTGKTSFGADLILSKNLNRKADLHGSIGYEINSDPDAVDIGNAFKWGIGAQHPGVQVVPVPGRGHGQEVLERRRFPQTDPVDLTMGLVFWIKTGVFIRPAFSYALNFDDRGLGSGFDEQVGRRSSIGYHPGTPCCEVYVPPPPPPPPPNRPPTVSLDCVKDTLLAGETTPCRATAADPDGDSLTYTWSTSAGKVTGSGPDATFDSASVPCDTTVTVTVQVSDGRGGTAQATDTVRVKCPEKPKPEPVTCTSGGFPRNMARLNNVDKACLDDLASRMKQDPRSRIVITGHADKSEPNAEVMGRKRAEAIKNYLVKERGVDEARVTARSAGATQAARHRHVRRGSRQEPARRRDLRPRGRHLARGRRLEAEAQGPTAGEITLSPQPFSRIWGPLRGRWSIGRA